MLVSIISHKNILSFLILLCISWYHAFLFDVTTGGIGIDYYQQKLTQYSLQPNDYYVNKQSSLFSSFSSSSPIQLNPSDIFITLLESQLFILVQNTMSTYAVVFVSSDMSDSAADDRGQNRVENPFLKIMCSYPRSFQNDIGNGDSNLGSSNSISMYTNDDNNEFVNNYDNSNDNSNGNNIVKSTIQDIDNQFDNQYQCSVYPIFYQGVSLGVLQTYTSLESVKKDGNDKSSNSKKNSNNNNSNSSDSDNDSSHDNNNCSSNDSSNNSTDKNENKDGSSEVWDRNTQKTG